MLREHDFARVRVRGQPVFDKLPQFLSKFLTGFNAGVQHDMGFDDFGAFGVGFADDGGFDDGGVFDQRAFDVERADAVAGAGDDVVAAADEAEIAVGRQLHGVAGTVVAVFNRRGGLAEVAGEPQEG